ncbi:N-acetylmuramoyl-L-alanine amidase LytC precursor [Desulfosporosinus acididurans]|uniref:N-acetylmuramoyl-L-alanine amidase LytC n=1 Tax=Desulfosporosinus acididurans TaxID=476652 RepID=A0A0J1FPK1_9FIRM|nr:cell wall-binding repeat-containing protein [Desulfosporosinus acididurans]KLU64888.1 N-acetylmuramoyl-L-alanine amidase LytC precursor [Desulfosporosinus acididurans]
MKKLTKLVTFFTLIIIAFNMLPQTVLADTAFPTRISGATQYDTAAQIADQGWGTSGSSAAVLAAGMTGPTLVDALSAGSLASALNIPIILTQGNTLTPIAANELTKLHVTKVYVTSGIAVIQQPVLDALKALNISVVPLGGYDASETSVNIAKEMAKSTSINGVVLTGGSGADAISAASIAGAKKMPILYTDNQASLPSSIRTYLTGISRVKNYYIIGGTAVISNAEMAQFSANSVRYAGYDAYDTNLSVLQGFDADINYANIFVANGRTLVDGLAGVPLAAGLKAPIVLTDGTNVKAGDYVHSKLTSTSVVTALGGPAVVSAHALNAISAGSSAASVGVTPVTSTNLPADTQYSGNWAGYIDTPYFGSGYTGISGAWTVPNIPGSGQDASSAQWIGLGGVNSSDLLQMGTMEEIINGQAVAEVFWEQLPAPAQIVMTVPIGSTIKANISQSADSSTIWDLTFTVNGKTQSESIPSVTLAPSYIQGIETSAEWISEDPSNEYNQLYPLANMGTVSYQSATVNGQPLYSAGHVEPVAMVSQSGYLMIAPSILGADGQSFSTSVISTMNNTTLIRWKGNQGNPRSQVNLGQKVL